MADLSALIDLIYQGATDPNHWNFVLPAIAEWLNAPKGMLFTPLVARNNGGYYFAHKIPDSMMQLLQTKYITKDLWAIRGIEKGLVYEGNVVLGEEILPIQEFIESEIYRELLSNYDMAHLLTSVIFGPSAPQQREQSPWSVCAWYQGLNDGPFTVDQRDRLKLLVPHLSRSLGVMTRLQDMELKISSSLAALNQLSSGVLLLDKKGFVAFANRAAKRIFDEQDGLRLRHLTGSSTLGEIVTDSTRTQAELNQAIRSAIAPPLIEMTHFSRAVVVNRSSGRQAYMLHFSSLAAQNEFGRGPDVPRAIAFVTDNAAPIQLDAGLIRKTYGLTPAELRMTKLIAEGLTVDEAANRIGVSRHTAKSHLKSVYAKTNTNNRAKLMRLIMSLAHVSS